MMAGQRRTHAIFLALCLLALGAHPQTEEDLLKIEASINPRRLDRGQEGKVVLKLGLKKGITINAQPSFTIDLKPSEELVFPKGFFTASDLEIEVFRESGKEYLILEDPLEILFTVGPEAPRGYHELEGKIKYFAQSEAENWCLKKTSKFKASFYVRNRNIKKTSSFS